MLNDSDLGKIRSVTREEIKTELKSELNKELKPIKQDLQEIGKVIDQQLEKRLKPIKHDLRKIKGDLNTVISVFDRDVITLRKRMDRVEDHLGFSPLPQ